MVDNPLNFPPVFTLRLGASGGRRAQSDVVIKLIQGAGVESFSLAESDGYFRGQADPGWAITIADNDLSRVARLADSLRSGFGQEGVGVEAFGHYLRSRADHGADDLAAELWGLRYGFHPAYFRTVFRLVGNQIAWPERFAIVTAYATTGETWTAEENDRADQRLLARLDEMGVWKVRITGQSPDGIHAEPGWATELSVGLASKIGAEFKQDAIYYVEEDQLSVVCCADGHCGEAGSFSKRILQSI